MAGYGTPDGPQGPELPDMSFAKGMAVETVAIRPIEAGDRAAWEPLYKGYAEFYNLPMPPETLDRVWGWLHDPAHVVEAIVAESANTGTGGTIVGLAHFRSMPSPLRGTDICFLDDLFVSPAGRGNAVGDRLIGRLQEIAVERGWPRIRWLTGDDNYRARTLYDRVGVKTQWNTYEIVI